MNRRGFLTYSGAAASGTWITMSMSAVMATAISACQARDEGRAYKVLTTEEAAEFEAIAAQIIPSDDTPGAVEAGVIYFIDTALAETRSETLASMRQGLIGLQADIRRRYAAESFASLSAEQQVSELERIEDQPFFGSVRFLTLAGMFSDPSHGGNRDRLGWALLGFEGPHAWQPPFGYYDADSARNGE